MKFGVVLDTNVVISAVLSAGGSEAYALNLVLARKALLYATVEILSEYEEVLSRPKFDLEPKAVRSILRSIRSVAIMVLPRTKVRVSADDDDNRFLECAQAANAHFLLTGNRRHFPEYWETTRVIGAREFVELMIDAERRG